MGCHVTLTIAQDSLGPRGPGGGGEGALQSWTLNQVLPQAFYPQACCLPIPTVSCDQRDRRTVVPLKRRGLFVVSFPLVSALSITGYSASWCSDPNWASVEGNGILDQVTPKPVVCTEGEEPLGGDQNPAFFSGEPTSLAWFTCKTMLRRLPKRADIFTAS